MLRLRYRLALGLLLVVSTGAAEQRVSSGYRDYNIRLTAWRPVNNQTAGLLVPVRINGSRMLRLLLDTGARGIVLGSRVARDLDLRAVSTSMLTGVGENGTRTELGVAGRVQVGELELQDAEVYVSGQKMIRDADGVIGMNVFEDFRIRLDATAKELKLQPFPDQPSHARKPGDHLLFVRARVNGHGEGIFLVDTGSAVTSLASDLQWPAAMIGGDTVLTGASGEIAAKRLAPVLLEIDGRKLIDREPVAIDLATVSRRNGMKVSGILGYSVLSRGPVVINYRDRQVELAAR